VRGRPPARHRALAPLRRRWSWVAIAASIALAGRAVAYLPGAGKAGPASSGSSPSAAAGVETRQNSRVLHRSLSEFATGARELYQATAKIKALRLSQRQ